jgi:CHAD domain-containing protein
MMRSDAMILLEYFDAICDRLRIGLRQAHDHYAIEGIHDLRVEIKRLRALFRLVSFLKPEFDARAEAKPFKPLFGVAGQLRDIDIQQAIILESLERHELSEFANELKQLEFALRPALLIAIKKFQTGRHANNRGEVARALKTMSAEELHDGLARRMKQLEGQIAPLLAKRSVSDIELHEIRKLSKASKYTLEVWQLLVKKDKTATHLSASLKAAYTYLGKWHDARVTNESLSRFLGRGTPRNLFDASAYRKFAAELVSTEAHCLANYRKTSRKLQTDLARLTTKVMVSPRAPSPHARRRAPQAGRTRRASAERKQLR